MVMDVWYACIVKILQRKLTNEWKAGLVEDGEKVWRDRLYQDLVDTDASGSTSTFANSISIS